MTHSTSRIHNICMIGLMTAVIIVMAQISLPLPAGVPMTLQTLGIMFAGIILGAKKGTYTTCIYIMVGLIGVPVFANFTGGYQCLFGPTGGFILSFPILAYLSGLATKYHKRFKGSVVLFLSIGNLINICCGALMFCMVTGSNIIAGLTTCVLPFLPITIFKIIIASIVGISIKKRL